MGKRENTTSAGWLVTMCDPTRHVSSHGGEANFSILLYCSRPDAGSLSVFLLRLVEEDEVKKETDELQLMSKIDAEAD